MAINFCHLITIGPDVSSPAIGCVALPHPRSSKLLAAAMRADSGASCLFMIAAKTVSAAVVCDRANDLYGGRCRGHFCVLLVALVFLHFALYSPDQRGSILASLLRGPAPARLDRSITSPDQGGTQPGTFLAFFSLHSRIIFDAPTGSMWLLLPHLWANCPGASSLAKPPRRCRGRLASRSLNI